MSYDGPMGSLIDSLNPRSPDILDWNGDDELQNDDDSNQNLVTDNRNLANVEELQPQNDDEQIIIVADNQNLDDDDQTRSGVGDIDTGPNELILNEETGSLSNAANDNASNFNSDSQDTVRIFHTDLAHSNDSHSNLSGGNSNGTKCNRKIEPHEDEPPSKVRIVDAEETDGETCPICLETWGNTGDHRVVSLKCGHLFGLNCVERWLKALSIKTRSCPTCKSKASLRDIRQIYVKRLVASDVTLVAELEKQVATLQSDKLRLELELEKSKIAHRACQLQLDVLRDTLMKSQHVKEPVRKNWKFALEKNLEVCRDGGCRVMTYNCRTYEFYVSQKCNHMFTGYGIRKVSCLDYKLGQYVHLHPKPIRDMTYSQPRDLLLSVGFDGTARIVERGIANVTINAGMPLWSCSWDFLRSNELFVGGTGGVIKQYDLRNPSVELRSLKNSVDISPVASVCSTEFGLLSCQLGSAWLWGLNERQWEPRSLPVSGNFTSLSYDSESRRALVCNKPSQNRSERAKLTLCKFSNTIQGEVSVNVEQTFSGSSWSSLMSRTAWVRTQSASWVAAPSESDSALCLHGLEGARSMTLPAAEPALDVCSAQLNGDTLLAALSESRLRIYRAVLPNAESKI